jgi:hypothetical protein
MFGDIVKGQQQQSTLQLNSAGFDSQEFNWFISEADSSIGVLIESYRQVMTQALTESASVFNENTTMIFEQANEHVGDKLKKWLDRFIEFVKRAFDASINFVKSLIMSNKSFLEKVKEGVEKKNLSAEDKKQIKVSSYKYNPEFIKVGGSDENLKKIEEIANFKISEDAAQKISDSLGDSEGLTGDQLKIHYAKKLITGSVSETDNWGTFKAAVRKELVGDTKIVLTFSGDEFSKIEDINKKIEEVESGLVGLSGKFKNTLNKIQAKIGEVIASASKNEGKSEGIRAINMIRLHISAVFEAVNTLKQMKLQVFKDELRDLRLLCMAAYRHKTGKVLNDSAVEPFDAIFESEDSISLEEGADDSTTLPASATIPAYNF